MSMLSTDSSALISFVLSPMINTTILSEDENASFANRENITIPVSKLFEFYPLMITEMFLSIVCLIITCLVYAALPEYRNVPGKNLLTLSCCLLVSYICLTVDMGFRNRIPYVPCLVISVVIHVTFLATFFWTNVMSYDIMKAITHSRPGVEMHYESGRYLKYSAYAWTSTLLVALPALIMQFGNLGPSKFRPNFGVKRCWLAGSTEFQIYFTGPVGVILLCNVILFVKAAIAIAKVKRATTILSVKQHRKRFNLYVKLVLVMGLIWLTEFIPMITGMYKLYAMAGILNSLHGVFLFAIFICKKKIWRKIIGCSKTKSASSECIRRQLSPSLVTIVTASSSHQIATCR